MNYKIVSDSSSNLLELSGVDFACVPLKIVAGQKEYVDDRELDLKLMLEEMAAYKGRSSSACPNVGEWLESFGEAEGVFAISITSTLSGSYNALVQAAGEYESEHPGRRVCCLDSLSAGPELALIIEKLQELISQGLDFDSIERQIRRYMQHTHLLFQLERVDNLAKNGRISPLIAKAVGVLDIRFVGKASDEGTLQQLHKCRGLNRGLKAMVSEMEKAGYKGGRAQIAHCFNEPVAHELRRMILSRWPSASVDIAPFTALCAYYAEDGGIMLGFEDGID